MEGRYCRIERLDPAERALEVFVLDIGNADGFDWFVLELWLGPFGIVFGGLGDLSLDHRIGERDRVRARRRRARDQAAAGRGDPAGGELMAARGIAVVTGVQGMLVTIEQGVVGTLL